MAGHAASRGESSRAIGTTGPGFDQPIASVRHSAGRASGSKGFLSLLFDIGFTSFGTPRVVKVLYVLIIAGTIISALFYAYIAFITNTVLGILTLFVFAPLCTLIILTVWRITLEFFMIIFRISEDIRAVCGRSELR